MIIPSSHGKYKWQGGEAVNGAKNRTAAIAAVRFVHLLFIPQMRLFVYYLPIKAQAYCGFSSASFLKIVFFCAMAACAAARRAIGTRNGEQDT